MLLRCGIAEIQRTKEKRKEGKTIIVKVTP